MIEDETLTRATKTRTSVVKGLIATRTPAFLVIIITYLAIRLIRLNGKIVSQEKAFKAKLTAIEASHASSARLCESRKIQIEKTLEHFSAFDEPTFVFYIHVIEKLKKIESHQAIPNNIERKIANYQTRIWNAYADINKAKSILELNGFNDSAHHLILVVTHASRGTDLYRDFLQHNGGTNARNLETHLKEFRSLRRKFLNSLSNDYKSLIT
ncbi:hypothetical protein [Pseudomonas sp. NA-150]|uniref:hypothetical protein n=1 Tax=Pseudomonas sp. NA-150 TaxID=3367525 RepID=UPI0037CA815E